MYVGRNYAVSFIPMSYLDGFNFINDLDVGDSVLEATANMTVQSGTDPSPSSRLFGVPIVLSATNVVQNVGNLLPGVTYTLQIVVTTIGGDTLSLYSSIPSRAVF